MELPELYFESDTEWRTWLHDNHATAKGLYLIFYKVNHEKKSMRWEEAVKVALCYGWIDATVKSLGEGKRRQYFCPRKPKSVWSAVNKNYVVALQQNNLMHSSGLKAITLAKANGSWTALDDVEQGVIPDNLQRAFDKNKNAYSNFNKFAPSYKKGYLYWLNQAKREDTKQKRIAEIIKLCDANIKTRGNR
ncbi:MAG: YdeI/OmpD-associated family protein [Winogradskyella arenosi]